MYSKEILFDNSFLENQNSRLFNIDSPMFSRWVFLSDLLLVPAIYGVCLMLFHKGFVVDQIFSYNLAFLMAIQLGVNIVTGRYSVTNDVVSVGYMAEYLIIGILSLLLVVFYSLGLQYFFSPGMTPLTGLAVSSILFSICSLYLRRELYQITRIEERRKELIVIGTGEKAQKFYQTLQEKKPYRHYSFFSLGGEHDGRKHLIDDDLSSPKIRSNLADYLKNSRIPIGSIVLTEEGSSIPADVMKKLVSAKFSHIEVKTLANYHADKWQSFPEYDLSPFWHLEENAMQVQSLFSYATTKRLIDILVAGSALFLLSPIALLVGLAVKLESQGPALFKQSRVGLNGKLFTIYKFRSMTVGSEKGDVYTRKGDARITRLGGFMRKTRLDEIPQLWNILKGDMSLIGPRPEWNILVEGYEKEIGFYHFRHLVKPGLTGWAQVNYPYGACLQDTVEKLKYDLYYVQRSSSKLDLMVVLKTVYTILGFKGL